MARYGVVGPAYQSESPLADLEDLFNWYVESMESDGATSKATLYPRPWLTTFATLASGPIRGSIEANGRCFIVGGADVFELFSDGTYVSWGTVANDGLPASLCASPLQLMICSGEKAYYLNLNETWYSGISAVTAIASLNYGGTASVAWGTDTNVGIRISGITSNAIASASEGGTTAQITVDVSNFSVRQRSHLLVIGAPITVAGVGVAGYNGDWTISYVDSSTPSACIIQYTAGGSGLAPSSGGTVTLPYMVVGLAGGPSISPNISKVTIFGASHAAYNGTFTFGYTTYGTYGTTTYNIFYLIPSLAIIHDAAVDTSAAQMAQETSASAPINGPLQCAFSDGYFVVLFANSSYWAVSALYDVTSWDATNVARVSVFTENVVAMAADHREVWMLGNKHIQPFYNSGNTFPFDVVQSGFMEQGCVAPFSPCRLDNSLFWLGQDERGFAVAWRANGYLPQRVSNHAVEKIWRGYSTVADAVSMTYQWNGHTFWSIWFPTADATWVYDAATGTWRQDGYWNGVVYQAHQAGTHILVFGLHLVTNITGSIVYKLSDTGTALDGANPVRFQRTSPQISTEEEWMTFEKAVFNVEDPAAAPTASSLSLTWTDDSGTSWATPRTLDTSQAGHGLNNIVQSYRMGRSRRRVYRITTTSPLRLIEGYVSASPGYRPTERLSKQLGKSA